MCYRGRIFPVRNKKLNFPYKPSKKETKPPIYRQIVTKINKETFLNNNPMIGYLLLNNTLPNTKKISANKRFNEKLTAKHLNFIELDLKCASIFFISLLIGDKTLLKGIDIYESETMSRDEAKKYVIGVLCNGYKNLSMTTPLINQSLKFLKLFKRDPSIKSKFLGNTIEAKSVEITYRSFMNQKKPDLSLKNVWLNTYIPIPFKRTRLFSFINVIVETH